VDEEGMECGFFGDWVPAMGFGLATACLSLSCSRF
jgi:hypothetical protein